MHKFRTMRRNRHAVNGYGDASGGNNSGVIRVRRTALTAMEMNGSKGLVIWDNKYIRVTLGET